MHRQARDGQGACESAAGSGAHTGLRGVACPQPVLPAPPPSLHPPKLAGPARHVPDLQVGLPGGPRLLRAPHRCLEHRHGGKGLQPLGQAGQLQLGLRRGRLDGLACVREGRAGGACGAQGAAATRALRAAVLGLRLSVGPMWAPARARPPCPYPALSLRLPCITKPGKQARSSGRERQASAASSLRPRRAPQPCRSVPRRQARTALARDCSRRSSLSRSCGCVRAHMRGT